MSLAAPRYVAAWSVGTQRWQAGVWSGQDAGQPMIKAMRKVYVIFLDVSCLIAETRVKVTQAARAAH